MWPSVLGYTKALNQLIADYGREWQRSSFDNCSMCSVELQKGETAEEPSENILDVIHQKEKKSKQFPTTTTL